MKKRIKNTIELKGETSSAESRNSAEIKAGLRTQGDLKDVHPDKIAEAVKKSFSVTEHWESLSTFSLSK